MADRIVKISTRSVLLTIVRFRCNLQFCRLHGIEEVTGSVPTRPTVESTDFPSDRFVAETDWQQSRRLFSADVLLTRNPLAPLIRPL
jgi:hypothetical protein